MARHRQIAAALGAVLSSALLAGCGGSASKPNPGLNQAPPASGSSVSATVTSSMSTTPSVASTPAVSATVPTAVGTALPPTSSYVDYAPSPDPADPVAAEVLKAYRGYSDLKVKIYNEASMTKDLGHYAVDKAIDDLQDGVGKLRQGNVHYTGKATSRPVITSLSNGTATISDCFGGPNWVPVYTAGSKKGQSALAPNDSHRPHPIAATLKQYQGVWVVTDAVTNPEPC